MPSTFDEVMKDFVVGVDWERLVERLAKARNRKAIEKAVRHELRLAGALYRSKIRNQLRAQFETETKGAADSARLEAMAMAMAAASGKKDHKAFISQARVLDAAMSARRKHKL